MDLDWRHSDFTTTLTVSNYIYQEAVFKATNIIQIKSNNKLDGNLKLPPKEAFAGTENSGSFWTVAQTCKTAVFLHQNHSCVDRA